MSGEDDGMEHLQARRTLEEGDHLCLCGDGLLPFDPVPKRALGYSSGVSEVADAEGIGVWPFVALGEMVGDVLALPPAMWAILGGSVL